MTANRPITFPTDRPSFARKQSLPAELSDLFDTEDCDDSGACAHLVDKNVEEDQRGEVIRCA